MKRIINKIKDVIRTWLNIDLISNGAIYDINKTIGIVRNQRHVDKESYLNDLSELLQKDNELKEDIKAIKMCVNMQKGEFESLKRNFNDLVVLVHNEVTLSDKNFKAQCVINEKLVKDIKNGGK